MEKWRQSMVFGCSSSWCFIIMREVFNLFTINLLSLLLPLSFLLLSRLSRAQYVLSSFDTSDSYLLFIFLYTNPTLLHILVSFVSITTLVNGITGRRIISTISINDSHSYDLQQPQRRLYPAWILLCTLQVCVGLGIEGTISAGVWAIDGQENALVATNEELVIQMVFFVGLHETMVHWSNFFVRPVVEDTVFGSGSLVRYESRWWLWTERLVSGGSFGGLWWWILRNEVQGLILVGEVKRELLMAMGISDIVSWWLYYITVTIGAVKLVRGFIWFFKFLLCTTPPKIPPPTCDGNIIDEKV